LNNVGSDRFRVSDERFVVSLAVDVDDAFFAGADDEIAEEAEFGAKVLGEEDASVGIEVGFGAVVVSEIEKMFDFGGVFAGFFEDGEVLAPDGFRVDANDGAIEGGSKRSVIFKVMSKEMQPGAREANTAFFVAAGFELAEGLLVGSAFGWVKHYFCP
jgi:hypothetical protein